MSQAGSDHGPFGVFNSGECPSHWYIVGDLKVSTSLESILHVLTSLAVRNCAPFGGLQVCRESAAEIGLESSGVGVEWAEDSPFGCYLDTASQTLK